jgi:hypothetical protein
VGGNVSAQPPPRASYTHRFRGGCCAVHRPGHQLIAARFSGKIVEAPEPDPVLWPHLAYSDRDRKKRKYGCNICTGIVLLLGFIGCTQADNWSEAEVYTTWCNRVVGEETDLADNRDQLDTMKSACPGILRATRGAEPLLPVCRDLGSHRKINCTQEWMDYSQLYRSAYTMLTPLSQHWIWETKKQAFPQISRVNDGILPWGRKCKRWREWTPSPNGKSASCHRVDGSHRDRVLYTDGDMDSMCYACVCKLESLAAKAALQHGDDYCEPFETATEETHMFVVLAAGWVVIVNQGLKRGIKATAYVLKAHTLGIEMAETAKRVWVVQLLNTVILTLILKTNLYVVRDLPGEHYKNMIDSKWYAEVAAPMVKTMLIQFVIPWAIHAGTFALSVATRSIGRCRARTQNAMNRCYEPDEFNIAGSYGEVLLAMSVILIFGSGVPLLYWVGFGGFTGRYWVDKYVVLRVFKRPPMLSQQLFADFDEMFMLVLLVHAAMGCFMLMTAGGTDPIAESQILPSSVHVFPMYLATGLVVIAGILKIISNMDRVSGEGGLMESPSFPGWLKFLMGSSDVASSAENEKLELFSQALRLNQIANRLDSYEIPLVQELDAFSRALNEEVNLAHTRDQRPPFSMGRHDDAVYRAVIELVKPLMQKGERFMDIAASLQVQAVTKIQAHWRGAVTRRNLARVKGLYT